MTTQNSLEARAYSPFWAVWSVFATLVVMQVIGLVNDFSERSQIIASRQETEKLMPEVERINRSTELMGRGLVDLANAGSPEAKKIAAELQIKVSQPAEAGPK